MGIVSPLLLEYSNNLLTGTNPAISTKYLNFLQRKEVTNMRTVALILPILVATMMAEAMTSEEIQEMRKTRFAEYDKDSDGCITKEEWSEVTIDPRFKKPFEELD